MSPLGLGPRYQRIPGRVAIIIINVFYHPTIRKSTDEFTTDRGNRPINMVARLEIGLGFCK